MNTTLWIAQILLALLFFAAGATKLTQPKEKLLKNLKWAEDYSPQTIRGIGLAEVLGAIGLVLPKLTGVLPWLTPLAALGLVVVMVLAAQTHVRRGEGPIAGVNGVLLVLAAFIAVGRGFLVP